MLAYNKAESGGPLSSAIVKLNSFQTLIGVHAFLEASPPELIAEIGDLLSAYPHVRAQYIIPLFRENGLHGRLDRNYAKLMAEKVNTYRQNNSPGAR